MLGNLEEAKLKQRVTPHALFGIRAEELRLATECVSALAVSELAPVIRLPNEINRSAGAVRNFAASYRSVNSAPRKRLQGFKEVQRRLSRAVPEEFLEFVRGAEVGVRVIADAHLEWLEVDGLPLMFRKSTSRIPVTPGNLFVQTIASPPPLHVTSKDLAHILVLNALDDKDPLRRAFAMALEVFGPQWGDALQFTFCEVRNEEDLVNAFNAFDGAIAIFDGHGGHEANEAAMLYLQGKGVNVWTLKNRITRIPPIILLSACDTHAADRNHATTGNGFLALGARSVLASVFPLDARQAAIFIARLLLRIAQYVPVAPSVLQRPVRWNEVIYGMLQMQIMTDFLLLLQRSGYIDDETLSKAQYRANNAINGGDGPPEPDPFQFMVDYLASLGVELERVSESLQIAVANSNAISYVQLGRPESILIHDEEFLAAWSEFAAGS
jgi:hypothetical protein